MVTRTAAPLCPHPGSAPRLLSAGGGRAGVNRAPPALAGSERAQRKGGAEAGKKLKARTAGKRGVGLGCRDAQSEAPVRCLSQASQSLEWLGKKSRSSVTSAQQHPSDPARRRAPTALQLSSLALIATHKPAWCPGPPLNWRRAEGRARGWRIPPCHSGSPHPLPATPACPSPHPSQRRTQSSTLSAPSSGRWRVGPGGGGGEDSQGEDPGGQDLGLQRPL